MTTLPSPEGIQLQGLLLYDSEDLGVEYKEWLDLTTHHGRAVLAKAAIAVSNHGGGYLVLGYANRSPLQPSPCPQDLPEVTSDRVNEAVRRYSNPEFQCQTYFVPHPESNVFYPVIRVPASDVPVMGKRDQPTAELAQYKVYVRKPGPRSEEPHTPDEWRVLLDRCVRARREDMLDAIRSIVLGRIESRTLEPSLQASLDAYCAASQARWREVVSTEPSDSPARFPKGFYELGFAFANATQADTLSELLVRLRAVQRIELSGWPLYSDMPMVPGWKARAEGEFIEAWLGRTEDGKLNFDHYTYWRASRMGEMYTIESHAEDGLWGREDQFAPGEVLFAELPIQRLSEGLLFVTRLADEFGEIDDILVRCNFTGLAGRSLVFSTSPFRRRNVGRTMCHTQEVSLPGRASVDQIRDNLPEVVHGLLQPLYEKFNYQLRMEFVQRTILELLRAWGYRQ